MLSAFCQAAGCSLVFCSSQENFQKHSCLPFMKFCLTPLEVFQTACQWWAALQKKKRHLRKWKYIEYSRTNPAFPFRRERFLEPKTIYLHISYFEKCFSSIEIIQFHCSLLLWKLNSSANVSYQRQKHLKCFMFCTFLRWNHMNT